jgi:hypothetical protein
MNRIQKGDIEGLLLLPLIVSLALSGASLSHYSQQSAAGSPLGFARSSYATPALAPFGSAYPYDEQVGVTFTQDFSVLDFNVTAVSQIPAEWVKGIWSMA